MRSTKAALIAAVGIAVAAGTGTAALGIVGGLPVQQAPSWVGSLQLANGGHECGAALVSPTWAVTARHCLQVSLAQARFGSMDYTSGGELVGIAGAVTDPSGTDVALLRLSSAVAGAPVSIAGTSPAAGSDVTLLGWGQTTPQPGSTPPSRLLESLQSRILADSVCRAQGLGINGPTELCIQGNTSQTACYGDSGGPAVVNGMLVGVTSHGSRTCGDTDTVYEDVTALQNWIAQTTGITPAAGNQQPPATGGAGQGSGGAQPPVTASATPAPGSTPAAGGTARSGLHVHGDWALRSAPNGRRLGIVRDGSVVTVDCQAVGPRLTVAGLGNSRIWDHLRGRGFISDLAVAETPYQQRDPLIPACTGPLARH